METPYRAVSFDKHDIVTRDKMDQLQANYLWIKENTPRARFYRPEREPVDTHTVMVCGRVRIRRNRKRDTQKVSVRFPGKTFAATCRPAVTTGIVSDFQRNIFATTHGPKGANYPLSTGFEVTVNIAADKARDDVIKKNFWVHWHAFGYRTEEMAYGV